MVTVWPTCSASLTVSLRSSQVLPFLPVIANSSAESPFSRQPVTIIRLTAVFGCAAAVCACNATGQRLMDKAATNQNESFAILWNIFSSSSVLFCDLFLNLMKFPNCDLHIPVSSLACTRETAERSPSLHQSTHSSHLHSISHEAWRLFNLRHITASRFVCARTAKSETCIRSSSRITCTFGDILASGLRAAWVCPPEVILTCYIGFKGSPQCLRLEAPLSFCCFFWPRRSFGLRQQSRRSRAPLRPSSKPSHREAAKFPRRNRKRSLSHRSKRR